MFLELNKLNKLLVYLMALEERNEIKSIDVMNRRDTSIVFNSNSKWLTLSSSGCSYRFSLHLTGFH